LLKLRKLIDRILFYSFFRARYKSQFKTYGENIKWGRGANFLIIPRSVRVSCPELISLGSDIQIEESVYLQCHNEGEGLMIGNGVRINAHTHIQSFSKIVIEEKVLIAPFSLINSGKHGRGEKIAIMDQDYVKAGEITVRSGSWLGHGVKILGGAEVASNTTIAAGAIVTKKFSKENTTLVGVPAREL
jgi:acetyltransferase-like isoleucine patch superfamily enzyme